MLEIHLFPHVTFEVLDVFIMTVIFILNIVKQTGQELHNYKLYSDNLELCYLRKSFKRCGVKMCESLI